VSAIRVSAIRVSAIRVSAIRVSAVRVSAVRASRSLELEQVLLRLPESRLLRALASLQEADLADFHQH